MRKITILFVFSLIIQAEVLSQSCLPDGIAFYSQQEIDDFSSNYPNCTEIEGGVGIYSGVKNLEGLNQLTSIEGFLRILDCDSLYSLSGLENLTHVGGILSINYIHNITDLTGLEGLTTIDASLNIAYNYGLTSLTGLESLTYIGGYLEVAFNDSLESLAGLDNLPSVGNYLAILNNPKLENLSGLDNITSVGYSLEINRNENLVNLTGLNKLSSVGYGFRITFNNSMVNLSGLDNVTSIGAFLVITHNPVLNNIDGMANIDAGSIANLYISTNHSLDSCSVQSVCDYIASPNGELQIAGNEVGCNSVEEVEEDCYSNVADLSLDKGINMYPNPAKNELHFSSSNDKNIKEVSIYNQLGQRVLFENNVAGMIDISRMQQGIYIVKLAFSDFSIRRRLVIKKSKLQ